MCGLGVPVGNVLRVLRVFRGFRGLRAGKRQAGPPRRSDGSGLGVAFACAVGHSETLLQSCNGLKLLKRFWQRQAWTPIRSH